MRSLRLDDAGITAVLEKVDARTDESNSLARKLGQRFPYRMKGVKVDFQVSRDLRESYEVVAYSIGRNSVSFLASNVIHMGTPCVVHLIGIQNNTEEANATVVRCRYIEGTACVHAIDCTFDKPVDPASFAATAIRARVMLADASPMSRRLLAHMLEPLNVELVTVSDGITAVQRATSETFDLILIDPVLPKLDGMTAVKFLRKKGYLRPVCAVSTKTGSADREAALLAGCEDFLPKPVKREHIEAVVQKTRPQPLVSSMLDKVDMRPLIDEFVLDLLDRSSQLESAFASGDLHELLQLAMTLKADAGGFGFEMITAAADDVERGIVQGLNVTELRPKLSRLVRLCQAARPATCDAVADDHESTGDGADDAEDVPQDENAEAPSEAETAAEIAAETEPSSQ